MGQSLIKSNTTYSNLEGPGIENFQIIGDAVPGGMLLGCGYPVRGTSLCMFQVKFLENPFQTLRLTQRSHFMGYLYVRNVCLLSVGSSSSGWHWPVH